MNLCLQSGQTALIDESVIEVILDLLLVEALALVHGNEADVYADADYRSIANLGQYFQDHCSLVTDFWYDEPH